MQHRRIVSVTAIAAILFGALTVLSGGRALFGSPEVRAGLGHTVSFVLWFNFLAGFGYILAGAGLLLRRRWAVHASLFIALSTTFIFAAFGTHVMGGGAFEMRTMGALIFRILFWMVVTVVSLQTMQRTPDWKR